MTNEQEKMYLFNSGTMCPFCESDYLEGGSLNVEDTTALQTIHCLDCNKQWTDTFRRISAKELK